MRISDFIDTRPDTAASGPATTEPPRTDREPSAPRARPSTIDSLTGVRGVAAVWVFLTHYQAVMAEYLRRPEIGDNTLLYNGFRGVDLFFVLSGFILVHVHEGEFRKLEAATIRRFYLLRFFRVYPLNAAVLIALVPLALGSPGLVEWFRYDHGVAIAYHDHDFSAAGFVQSLLLAQSWTVLKLGEWNGPAWSLSAEVFAYAFFPLLAWALVRTRSALLCVVAAGLSLSTLMVLLALGHHTQDSPTGTFGLIRCVFGFMAGACMGRAFHLRRAAGAGGRRFGRVAREAMSWLAVAAIAGSLSAAPLNMFIVFGFCLLIYALAWQGSVIDGLLSCGPAMFLGRISFSLYMVHYIPLKLSTWFLQTHLENAGAWERAACLAAIPLLCVALAMLLHVGIELPFQRYARTILRRGRDPHLQVALAS